MKNPSIDAANIFGRSFLSTFSFGMNRDRIQKREPAPMERRQKMARGEIRPPLVRSLQTIMLNPKMEYAIRQARWPANEIFARIGYVLIGAKLVYLWQMF